MFKLAGKQKRIWALCLVMFMMLGIVLSGCGKSGPATSASPTPSSQSNGDKENGPSNPTGSGDEVFDSFGITPLPQKTVINVGYFSGALYSAIIYGADQKGWYEKAGIELKYQSFDNGPAMMEANASWDVGISGAPGVLNGVFGYPIKCIAVVDYEQEQSLYVRPDSKIAESGKGHISGYPDIYGKPEDWKGTSWVMPVGTTVYMVFLDTLNKIGLTLDDVTVINMDVASAKSAFLGGQADGAGLWLTTSLSVAAEGYVKAASAADGSILASGMVATENALKNKFDAVKTFYEVFVKAQEYFGKHQDEYVEYFYETCVEEGVSVTKETAADLTKTYKFLDAETIIKNAITETDDVKGLANRKVLRTEADLLVMLDFFIGQNRYEPEKRDFFLNNGCVDPSVAKAAASDLGIK